jgi:glutamate dehydrogenase
LAAYAENTLADSIRNTSLVRDPHFDSFLRQYFPQPLVERLGDDVNGHPLRDDIIATMVANDAINIGGVTAIFRLMEETTADETAAAKAFIIASELFGLRDLSINLVHACADLPAEMWSPIYLDIRRVLDRAMRWFLQYDHQRPIAECVELYRPVVEALASRVPELLVGRDRLDVTSLREAALSGGIPGDIARTWAELRESFTLLDIARVHQLTGESLDVIAPVYYTVHERFGIEELLKRIDRLPRSTKWQAMARASLRDDLSAVVPELTVAVLGSGAGGQDQLGPWEEHHRNRLREAEQLLRSAPQDSFEVLSAHIGALRRAASA